jgi:hypothetical protein
MLDISHTNACHIKDCFWQIYIYEGNDSKKRVKLSLFLIKHHAIMTYGRAEIQLHAFLTSPLDGSEWSVPCTSCFIPPGKEPWYHLDTRLGEPKNWSGYCGKVKVEFSLRVINWAPCHEDVCGVEIWLYALLTLALDGGEWSPSCLCHLITREQSTVPSG